MTTPRRIFAAPAVLAALSLSTPAAATPLPTASRYEPAQTVSHYGWGWGHRHRYRHRGRTTAGDVLAGVLILGTIAAVASAASKAERRRDYPYPERYPRQTDRRWDDRRSGPQGLDNAADLCVREIEREARVEDVTRVERDASGWLVTGTTADGAGFTCSIGADGRIERIELGGRQQDLGEYDAGAMGDGDEFRSAQAEAEIGPQPEYPGGPLPGEADGDEAEPES